MAVVGEALVRVRVISEQLANDIRQAVKDNFAAAESAFDEEGKKAGKRAGQSASQGVKDAKPDMETAAKDVGDTFDKGFSQSLRDAWKSRSWPNFSRDIKSSFRTGFANTKDDINNGLKESLDNLDLSRFEGLGITGAQKFLKGFNFGIPSSVGPGAIAALLSVAPAVFSDLAALGPAVGGAIGVGAAGLATFALNLGLVSLALSGNTTETKAFKKEVQGFQEDLQKAFAPQMLGGFSDAMRNLRDNLLPGISDSLRATGAAIGDVARGISATVTSAGNLQRLNGILNTNTTFLGNLKVGLSGLTTGFLILFNAAKPFVDYLGTGVANLGTWLSNTLSAKEANGELGQTMQNLLDRFKDLMGILGNFTVGIYKVFAGAAAAGQPFLTTLQNVSQSFRDWATSTEGQQSILTFFERAQVLGRAVFGLIGAIAGGIAGLIGRLNVEGIAGLINTITNQFMPALGTVFTRIGTILGPDVAVVLTNLGVAVTNISRALTDFANSDLFGRIVAGFGEILVVISAILAHPIVGQILGIAAGFGILAGLFGILSPLIDLVVAGITALAGALSLPIAVVAAIAAGFALVYANSESFRNAISQVVTVLSGTFATIWDKIGPKVENLWGKLQQLAEVIGNILGPVIEFLLPIVSRVFTAMGDTIGFVVDAISNVIQIIVSIAHGDWAGAWDAFLQIFRDFWQLLQDMWNNIGVFIVGILDNVRLWIGEKITQIGDSIGGWISERWNGFIDILHGIFDPWLVFFRAIWNGIEEFFQTVIDGFPAWFAARWSGFMDIFHGIFDPWVTFFETLWSTIGDGVIAFVDAFPQWFSDRWNGLIDTFHGIFDPWVDFFVTLWNTITDGVVNFVTGFPQWFSDRWNGLIDLLHGIFDPWIDFFVNLWNTIIDGISTAWNAIGDFFSTKTTEVVTTAETSWTGFTDWLGNIWNVISGTVVGAWNAIGSFFSTVTHNIADTASNIWNGFINYLSNAWSTITSQVSSAWNNILSFFSNIWANISNVFHSVVDAVVGWLAGQWNSISSTASSIWSGIVGIASSIWNNITSTISGIANGLIGTLQGIWNTITGAVSSAWNGLSGTVSGIWEGIKSAIVNPIQSAYTEVKGWIDDITGAVTGAWSTVSGIIDNIKSAVGAAASAATTAAGFNNPLMPAVAQGGTVAPVMGGTVVRVAEAGAAERIEPLDSQGLSARDKAIVKALAGNSGGGPIYVTVKIGETELTGLIDTQVSRATSQLAHDIAYGG